MTWALVPGPILTRKYDNDLDKSYLKRKSVLETLKEDSKISSGVGVCLNLGGGKLEVLYNFAHYCKAFDKPANFQIRLSLND